jgi:hypothetical protein
MLKIFYTLVLFLENSKIAQRRHVSQLSYDSYIQNNYFKSVIWY